MKKSGDAASGAASRDAYLELVKKFRLAPIESAIHLEQAQKIVDDLSERPELSDDEKQYFNVLVDLVAQYEHKTVPPPDLQPVDLLKHLMEVNNLKAIDLVEIFGSRSVASDVLNGKRDLSKTHIVNLAEYFHLSPSAFFARPQSDPMVWRQLVTAFEGAMSARQFQQAQEFAEKGFEEAKKFGSENTRVCTSLIHLARVHRKRGLFEDAEKLLEKALDVAEKSLPPNDKKTQTILIDLGYVKKMRGRIASAFTMYERALESKTATEGESPVTIAPILEKLAEMHVTYGRYDEGGELLKRALAIRESATGIERLRMISTLTQFSRLYTRSGQTEEAIDACRKATIIGKEVVEFADASIDGTLLDLAFCYASTSQLNKARELSDRALAAREFLYGPDHPLVAIALTHGAGFLRRQKLYSKAEERLIRALKIEESVPGEERPHLAETLFILALVAKAQEKFAEAITLLKRVIAIREKHFGPQSLDVTRAVKQLNEVQRLMDESVKTKQEESSAAPKPEDAPESSAPSLTDSKTVVPEAILKTAISHGEKYYTQESSPESYKLGAKVADSEEFRAMFARFILAVVTDPKQLVYFRKLIVWQIQKTLNSKPKKSDGMVPITWWALSLATDRFFSERARLYGWGAEAEEEIRTKWYQLIEGAFIPADVQRRVDISKIRSFNKQFIALHKQEKGPLPACAACTSQCVYKIDVAKAMAQDEPTGDRTDPVELARQAKSLCEQYTDCSTQNLDLSYCFAVHMRQKQEGHYATYAVLMRKTRASLL